MKTTTSLISLIVLFIFTSPLWATDLTSSGYARKIVAEEVDAHVIDGSARVITALNILAKSSEITTPNCTDPDNPDVAKYLGGIDVGRWVEYRIDVQKEGSYRLYPRISSPNANRAFDVYIDGVKVASITSGAATGSWQNWETREDQAQTVNLESGIHTLRLEFTERNLNMNILYFEYNTHVINGNTRVITAQNIRSQSSEISPYNSTDSENPDVTKHLGYCNFDEWVEYEIDVQKGGSYKLYPRIASNGVTGAFEVDIDGVQVASFTSEGATGGWQWSTREEQAQTVNLEPGMHTLRLIFTEKGLNLNILYFEYDEATSLSENLLGNSVKIYPNPVQRGQDIQIDVQLTQGKAGRAELYDITGKRVASFEITGNRTNLPTTLNPGLYLLKITGRELYKEAKIVIL